MTAAATVMAATAMMATIMVVATTIEKGTNETTMMEASMDAVQGERPGEQDGKVWLVTSEAAERARVGPKTIFREVRAGRLKAARVGGRRELRFRASWVDAWLEARSTAVEIDDDRQKAA